MDNFRRPKRQNNYTNTDGMLRRRPRSASGIGVRNTSNSEKTQFELPESSIGNFSRQEGFLPHSPSSRLPDGRSLGRKPKHNLNKIDMDIEEKPKKRRFSKKQRSW